MQDGNHVDKTKSKIKRKAKARRKEKSRDRMNAFKTKKQGKFK